MMTTKLHYSEADLLETYYMQPGESMPVMMHLASCSECAARYERLERKLREAATCRTSEKPETFWSRQRIRVTRRIEAAQRHSVIMARVSRIAAAAVIAFLLGGVTVFKTIEPELQAPAVVVKAAAAPSSAHLAKSDDVAVHDAWQSDELQNYHQIVQWESWTAESQSRQEDNTL
ncbi:MAG TPA: hypothetical protein VEZ11_14370 [Thermoanaerobaculia bacterium]|nr:hypothetical protein [Thermoanaerobaculia bacterium]